MSSKTRVNSPPSTVTAAVGEICGEVPMVLFAGSSSVNTAEASPGTAKASSRIARYEGRSIIFQ